MSNQFGEEQVAIVTGASSGIGRTTAVTLIRKGLRKICLTGRKLEELQKTEQLCRQDQTENIDVLIVNGLFPTNSKNIQ